MHACMHALWSHVLLDLPFPFPLISFLVFSYIFTVHDDHEHSNFSTASFLICMMDKKNTRVFPFHSIRRSNKYIVPPLFRVCFWVSFPHHCHKFIVVDSTVLHQMCVYIYTQNLYEYRSLDGNCLINYLHYHRQLLQ